HPAEEARRVGVPEVDMAAEPGGRHGPTVGAEGDRPDALVWRLQPGDRVGVQLGEAGQGLAAQLAEVPPRGIESREPADRLPGARPPARRAAQPQGADLVE